MVEQTHQPGIRVRHGGLFAAQLQLIRRRGMMGAADQIQPFLDVFFMNKTGFIPFPFRLEEDVQVKFVELSPHSDLPDVLRHAVSEQHHARQGGIRVIFPLPGSLGALLIGIRPAVNLFFNKLAGVQGAERRSGKVQVVVRSDRQILFIADIAGVGFRGRGVVFFFLILHQEQSFGVFLPRPKVVFVKDNQIPVDFPHPFMLGLDAARFLIHPQKVLKGAEAHNRLSGVRLPVLLVNGLGVRPLFPADELPAFKVQVRFQVFLPRRLHRRLEGQDERPARVQPPCQLVSGKGFAKAHFGVPQKTRRASIRAFRFKVVQRPLHGFRLFRAHGKIPGTVFHVGRPGAHRQPCRPDFFLRTAEPFSAHSLHAFFLQHPVYGMVRKAASIFIQSRFREDNPVGFLPFRPQGRVLLRYAFFHIHRRISYF